VERPHVLVEEKCRVEEVSHVINIVQPTLEPLQDAPILEDLTKEEMHMCSLLSLPRLPTRPTQGRELLIDHSQSHVMTFADYINVL
jgi:hypothetical protein